MNACSNFSNILGRFKVNVNFNRYLQTVYIKMTERTSATVAAPASELKTQAKVSAPKKVVIPKAAVKTQHHPSTAAMVKAAVKALAEKNGSSLQAIKKYIVATYNLDAEKLSSFIRKSLKSAVIDGSLIQVKGKGANGSFKLPVSKASAAKPKPKTAGAKKAPVAKKPVTGRKPAAKKPVAKKEVTKVATAEKKGVKAATKVAKLKTAPKAKKVTKAPTAKPKAPRPKKATTAKVAKLAVKKAPSKK